MRGALGTTRLGRYAIGGWSGSRIPLALAGLAVFLLLAIAGCGGAASPDPFLGTWKETDSPSPIVIGKPGGEYVVTTWLGTFPHAKREGDRLHFWAGDEPKPGTEFYLTYQPSSGQLLFTDPLGPGVHIEYRRASESTAIPSPFPGGVGREFSTP